MSASPPVTTPSGRDNPRTAAQEQEQGLARTLINNLFVLIRTAYIHDPKNAALVPPLRNIEQSVRAIIDHFRDDTFSLRIVSNTFFLNDTLVRLDQSSYQNAEFLHVICADLDIGEIIFGGESAENDFRALMTSVVEAIRGGPAAIVELSRDLGPILLKPTLSVDEADTLLDRRQFILRTYALAIVYCNRLLAEWSVGKRPRLNEIKRLIQGLWDIVRMDAVTLLGLTQLRAYKQHLANHFVNVAILTLVMGQRAGLGKRELIRLGMTGLLHEIGTLDLPAELIARIDTLGASEREALGRLPIYSTRRLMAFEALSRESIARIVSVFENRAHIPGDVVYHQPLPPDTMAAFVAVADGYDHLTTSRMGRTALQPDQALEVLLLNREQKFVPWAVKLLADAVGRYPIGTVVELSTGERGIVFDRPRSGAPASRPRVRIVASAGGQPLAAPTIVDLAEGAGRGRSIVRTLDAEREAINVPHFFLD